MAELLKGAPAAKAMTEALRAEADELRAHGVMPCLALLRVGEKEADLAYERGALRRCEQVGIAVQRVVLPADAPQSTLLAELSALSANPGIHGILPLRPLPAHFDDAAVCAAIAPAKDVEGVSPVSLASVYAGVPGTGFPTCTAEACLALLHHYRIPLRGKRALVIGRSLVIGRPVSLLLLSADATVSIAHTKTQALPALCHEADILIVATGQEGLIGAEHVRPGHVVVDVGIHAAADGTLSGDVRFAEVEPIVDAITPVPGGVGAMTTAVLAAHVIAAAKHTVL